MSENIRTVSSTISPAMTLLSHAQRIGEIKRAAPSPPETPKAPVENAPAPEKPPPVSKDTEVQFSVPHDHHVVIKVVDKESGKVITTIPPLAEQLEKLRR